MKNDEISDKELRRIVQREFPTFGPMMLRWLDRLDADNVEAQRRQWIANAESQQRQRIAERDIALSGFQACQECPQCGTVRYHLMDTKAGIDKFGYLTRVCGECEHTWRQK